MAKPKPTEYSIATSVTIPLETVVKINKLTDNRSAWIRKLIDKEIARVEKLNKLIARKETATMQDDQWTQEQEQKYQEYIAKNKEEMRR